MPVSNPRPRELERQGVPKCRIHPSTRPILPEYYLRIFLKAGLTTRSLETAPKSLLLSIFDDPNVIEHPDIYDGEPIFPFVAQRIMMNMTKSQRKAVGLAPLQARNLPCKLRKEPIQTWTTWDTCFDMEPGQRNRAFREDMMSMMVRHTTAGTDTETPNWAPKIDTSYRAVHNAYTMSHGTVQRAITDYVDSDKDCWFATLGLREPGGYSGFVRKAEAAERQAAAHPAPACAGQG